MRVQHALNQCFNFAAAGFLPKQPRAHHFGVVEHQHIACVDVAGQIGELFVGERRIGQRNQQAAVAARSGRVLRDKVFGENKIKIGKLHDVFGGWERGAMIRGLDGFFRLPFRRLFTRRNKAA